MSLPPRAMLARALGLVTVAALVAPRALAQQGETAEQHEVIDAGAAALIADAGAVSVQPVIADAAVLVASGRGVAVTAGEVLRRVADAPEPTQRQWAQSPQGVDDLVERIVSDRVLVNEARRLGLDRDPAVLAATERALVARLRASVINPAAGDGANVTADEIRGFYDAHPTRFHIPERRTARIIFVASRREAETALRLARAMHRRRAVNDFQELAARFNRDPDLVQAGGELREVLLTQPDLDVRLRDAIYAVPAPGDVHPLLVRGSWRGERGYFIVRLTGRRAAIERTLSESSDWIRQRLVLQHRVDLERALVERLEREASVTRMRGDQVVRVALPDGGVVNADGG